MWRRTPRSPLSPWQLLSLVSLVCVSLVFLVDRATQFLTEPPIERINYDVVGDFVFVKAAWAGLDPYQPLETLESEFGGGAVEGWPSKPPAVALLMAPLLLTDAEGSVKAMTWVNIAMFVLLVGLTGGATALGDAMLDRRLPSGKLSGIVYGGLAALGGVFSLPVLANSFFFKDFCDCERTPWLAGAFLVLAAIATVAGWSGRFTELPARTGLALRALGTGGVAGATLLGAVFLAREIDRIL